MVGPTGAFVGGSFAELALERKRVVYELSDSRKPGCFVTRLPL